MLISIITINYNNVAGLKKTMDSVYVQTYTSIEYIIIDGGSTDDSKAYIESCQQDLAYWISEPDKGIYHAMNKGIDKATGDYLLFLNSGDCLVDELVIERFVGFNPSEGIVYGDPMVRDSDKWIRKFMPKQMSIGVALTHTLNHQAEFYNRGVFCDNFRYDTSYKMISDWILTNNAIIFKSCTIKYIDLAVCFFEDPGISDDFQLRKSERQRYLRETFDPVFLKLLHDYSKLYSTSQAIHDSFLVQVALKSLLLKAQWVRYFKKKS